MKAAALVVALSLSVGATEARADSVSEAGDVGAVLLPVGAAVGALVAKDHRGVAQLAESWASAMAVVYVLKPVVDRTRPDGGKQSFPSGHAASAFAGAGFLQRRYGWRLGAPAYAAAGFVAYSRVEAKRHYTTDVLAGAALGIVASVVFTHPRERVSVAPDIFRGRAGAIITIAW